MHYLSFLPHVPLGLFRIYATPRFPDFHLGGFVLQYHNRQVAHLERGKQTPTGLEGIRGSLQEQLNIETRATSETQLVKHYYARKAMHGKN